MIYVLWAELDDDLFVLLHSPAGRRSAPSAGGGRTSSLRADYEM